MFRRLAQQHPKSKITRPKPLPKINLKIQYFHFFWRGQPTQYYWCIMSLQRKYKIFIINIINNNYMRMDKKFLKLQNQNNMIVQNQINIIEPLVIERAWDQEDLYVKAEQELTDLMQQLTINMRKNHNMSNYRSKHIQGSSDTSILLLILQQKFLIKISRNSIHINTKQEAFQQEEDQIQLNYENQPTKNKCNTYVFNGRASMDGFLYCEKINVEVVKVLGMIEIQKLLLRTPSIQDLELLINCSDALKYFDDFVLAVKGLMAIYPQIILDHLVCLRLCLYNSNDVDKESEIYRQYPISQLFQFVMIFPKLSDLKIKLYGLPYNVKKEIISQIPARLKNINSFIVELSLSLIELENIFRTFEEKERQNQNYFKILEFHGDDKHFFRYGVSADSLSNFFCQVEFEYDIQLDGGQINQDSFLIQKQQQVKNLSYCSNVMKDYNQILYLLPDFKNLQRVDLVFKCVEGIITFLYPLLSMLPKIKEVQIQYTSKSMLEISDLRKTYPKLINNHTDYLKSLKFCPDTFKRFSYSIKVKQVNIHHLLIESNQTYLLVQIRFNNAIQVEKLILEIFNQKICKSIELKIQIEEDDLIQSLYNNIIQALLRLKSNPEVKITIEYKDWTEIKLISLSNQTIQNFFQAAARKCSHFTLNLLLMNPSIQSLQALVNGACEIKSSGRITLNFFCNADWWNIFSIKEIKNLVLQTLTSQINLEIGYFSRNRSDSLDQHCRINKLKINLKQLNFLAR